jgi:hypothetical protein
MLDIGNTNQLKISLRTSPFGVGRLEVDITGRSFEYSEQVASEYPVESQNMSSCRIRN